MREDQLTGALNRRGLDDAMQHELARAERRKSRSASRCSTSTTSSPSTTPTAIRPATTRWCILPRFSKTLRPTDIVARYGGEEFVILFAIPGSRGGRLMQRLQRELTKRFFLHDNERLLITFSAGVAELRGRYPGNHLRPRGQSHVSGQSAGQE